MNDIRIFYKRMHPDAKIPKYATLKAACCDLHAVEEVKIPVGKIRLVPLGFAMALPEGFEAQIRPRSGLAVKYGITVVNTPGTIDADYRGEVKVALINLGQEPYTISVGDRIAQMKPSPVYKGHFLDVGFNDLDDTTRGGGGFGHTGL